VTYKKIKIKENLVKKLIFALLTMCVLLNASSDDMANCKVNGASLSMGVEKVKEELRSKECENKAKQYQVYMGNNSAECYTAMVSSCNEEIKKLK
jgi:predicted RNase H-like nuclease (RuvC/YqgF family)